MDSALTVQARVVYALVLHQIHTQYGKMRLGYLWALFDTAWRVVMFWIMRTVMGFKPPHGMSILLFLLMGFGVYQIFRHTVTKCMGIKGGKMLTFPMITKLDLCISRTIVIWATEIVTGALMLAVGSLMGIEICVSNWGGLLFVILIIPLYGFSVGVLMESLSILYPMLDKIIKLLLRAGAWISGVFYSVSSFPSSVMKYLWYNPLLQLIEIGRESMSRGYDAMNYSYLYVSSVAAACLCLGLLLERYVRRNRR